MRRAVPLFFLIPLHALSAGVDTDSLTGPSRLVPFEPNYAIFNKADGDERALRGHYSLRYSLWSTNDNNPCLTNDCHELFFSYTGEFDFYLNTRPSGPVINRISNPAFHYRYRYNHRAATWIDIGLEHRSNGQTTEIISIDDVAQVQHAYAVGNHAYFDGISRGSNFVSIEGHRKHSPRFGYYAKLKMYLTQDSDIKWGPLAGSGTRFSDYDRLKLLGRWNFRGGEVSVEWTIGDKGLRTDSFNIDYAFSTFANNKLPIYVRYHHGPMQTLANYTQNQRALGIGLKLIP